MTRRGPLGIAAGAVLLALAMLRGAMGCTSFGASSPPQQLDATVVTKLSPGAGVPGAGVADAAALTGFCATQDASFCADFDQAGDASVQTGWTATRVDNSNALYFTDAGVRSPPRAFESRLVGNGGEARLVF